MRFWRSNSIFRLRKSDVLALGAERTYSIWSNVGTYTESEVARTENHSEFEEEKSLPQGPEDSAQWADKHVDRQPRDDSKHCHGCGQDYIIPHCPNVGCVFCSSCAERARASRD